MDLGNRKRDRTARLLKIQLLLWQHPHGLDIQEIARRCSVSERTVYRDLEALESELDVPVWEEGRKRGVTEGHFLPPINFTPAEAMNVFLATRLMQNLYNPHISSIASTFMKLNTIIPPPLRQQVQNTIDYLEKQPRDERRIINFDQITKAWLSQHRIRIQYQENPDINPEEHIIEPYFIEPAAWGRGIYMIAYSHLLKAIRTFKIQHIVGEVVIEPQPYEIPSDFDITKYLGSAWGMRSDKDTITVKLLFNQRVSQSIMHTILDPSQKIFVQANGSIIMELNICNTGDFRSWILNFGDNVIVLEPEILRQQIIATNKSIQELYT